MRYRPLRAPQQDGAALVDPPATAAVKLLDANRKLAETWDHASGLPFANWRAAARERLLRNVELIDRDTSESAATGLLRRPFILAGHQPSLFHPGVWLKNFLVDRIAKENAGNGINLIVDNDMVRHAGIHVPTGTLQSPRLADVPLDVPAPEMPWEERRVLDLDIFHSFASRLHEAVDPILKSGRSRRLLIDSLWPHVDTHVAHSLRHPVTTEPQTGPIRDSLRLGDCLAQGRHALEKTIGLTTREANLSTFVGLSAGMHDFLDHLLSRWHELHPIYNAALRHYRIVNHIRSRNHPAPDLAAEGEWLETPLWIWGHREVQRKRAFIRRVRHSWELSDRTRLRVSPLALGDAACWNDLLESKCHIKIRPRALITTMFARLILSDLFIHGIGGAKYDELTDALIRRFFGIEPPAFVTATATFRLPIDRPQVTEDDVRGIERRIRDTVHHPESFVEEVAGAARRELAQLADDKRELIAARWQDKQKNAWHDRVTHCNERMTALLSDVRERLLAERQKLLAELHTAELLASREFSFVLFPEETLPRALLDLCAGNA